VSIRHRKNRSQLVAEAWLSLEHHRPHRIRLYLWATSEALEANSPGRGENSRTVSGRTGKAVGAFNAAPWSMFSHRAALKVPWCIGELHFVRGSCDIEVLCHEIAHLQLHIQRVLVGVTPFTDMFSEEQLCYTIGRLTRRANAWLHEHRAYRRQRGKTT
jgi:hypothetical protein